MKKVVYFLGAGFSAPAGIPVISDFIFKAQEQFAANPDKLDHFAEVFKYIASLAAAKSYTHVNLFNIEEVYSIASTHDLLRKAPLDELEQFIKDVISHHTPKTPPMPDPETRYDPRHGGLNHAIFGSGLFNIYARFAAHAMKIQVVNNDQKSGLVAGRNVVAVPHGLGKTYRVVSLNYDLLLEEANRYITERFKIDRRIELAKLHGSTNGRIVPPTWNKSIDNSTLEDWKNAARWLAEAEEIRILGYSLPETDIYVRHLFTTALMSSMSLQRIDVVCLDPDGSVRRRYDALFNFPRYRFVESNTSEYMTALTAGLHNNEFQAGSHNRFLESVM